MVGVLYARCGNITGFWVIFPLPRFNPEKSRSNRLPATITLLASYAFQHFLFAVIVNRFHDICDIVADRGNSWSGSLVSSSIWYRFYYSSTGSLAYLIMIQRVIIFLCVGVLSMLLPIAPPSNPPATAPTPIASN